MGPALRLKIGHKLFITLLLVVALMLVLTAVLSQRSFTRGFNEYLEAVEQQRISRLQSALVELYSEQGSWAFVQQNPRRWYRLMMQADLAPPLPQRRFSANRHERLPQPASPLPAGRVTLLDQQQRRVVGPGGAFSGDVLYPIAWGEQTIGYLAVERLQALHHLIDRQFARQQIHSFYLIALLALVVAAIAAWLLARQLSRPITRLTQTTRQLSSGNYQVRIEQPGRDELGALAEDVNRLATTLEKNRSARNQWIADISHELRTPLTILRGELDALEDGVRPLTREALQSLSVEVKQLQRLVSDLYELSLSDLGALTYHKEALAPLALLEEVVAQFQGKLKEKELTLTWQCQQGGDSQVLADPQRLAQLFANLLENSLRYTDAGGALRIRTALGPLHEGQARQALVIHFEDSAPGLSAEQLPKIFQRLYRADRSRSREHGGSGLGLSIVSSIAEALGGSIGAHNSPLGGVWIELRLPLLHS